MQWKNKYIIDIFHQFELCKLHYMYMKYERFLNEQELIWQKKWKQFLQWYIIFNSANRTWILQSILNILSQSKNPSQRLKFNWFKMLRRVLWFKIRSDFVNTGPLNSVCYHHMVIKTVHPSVMLVTTGHNTMVKLPLTVVQVDLVMTFQGVLSIEGSTALLAGKDWSTREEVLKNCICWLMDHTVVA